MHKRVLLRVLRDVCRHIDTSVALTDLARRGARSRFHFHRVFRATLGETPRVFVQRVRLQHAATQLLTTDAAISDIAHSCGFLSHEVLTRAFRRQFHCTPIHFRRNTFGGASAQLRLRHATLSAAIAPCIRLFQLSLAPSRRRSAMPTLSITRQERPAQPVLLIRRRIARTALQSMLAECFGKLYSHGQTAGLPIAGWPLARYVSMGPGLWTVEAAMPLAIPAAAQGEMEPGLLPGGPVAVGIHAGPYEQLPETNAAIEQWIEAHGSRAGGAPWESYVTDPAQHPDPADWRTEVCWPLAE